MTNSPQSCSAGSEQPQAPKLVFDNLKEAEDHLIAKGFKLIPDTCDWILHAADKTIGAGCYYVNGEDAFNSKVRIEYETLEKFGEAEAMQHDHYMRSGR